MNIEHALVGEPSAHQHRQYKPKTTHNVYLYISSTRITDGAVRLYLRDNGVNDIIRISKISQKGHESEFIIEGQGHQELFRDPANHQPSLAHLLTLSQHQQVPNTSQMIQALPTASYPSVHAFITSDPTYKNTTRYIPVCAPTQRNDNVHYQ